METKFEHQLDICKAADDCRKRFPHARVIQCLPNTRIEITKEQS